MRNRLALLAGLYCKLLALTLMLVRLCVSSPALAQNRDATTYEAFGAGSYGRSLNGASVSAFGWDASISQYPYSSHSWFGATIEASGLFDSQPVAADSLTLHDSTYTYMGGPSVAWATERCVRPFAHVLIGAVIASTHATGQGTASYGGSFAVNNKSMFGTAVGGGIDLPLAYHLAARAQADWLSFKEDATDRANNLRASLGLVFKF